MQPDTRSRIPDDMMRPQQSFNPVHPVNPVRVAVDLWLRVRTGQRQRHRTGL